MAKTEGIGNLDGRIESKQEILFPAGWVNLSIQIEGQNGF